MEDTTPVQCEQPLAAAYIWEVCLLEMEDISYDRYAERRIVTELQVLRCIDETAKRQHS